MIQSIHQIEVTSFCSLFCPYCAYPIMTRPRQHMSPQTFEAALDCVEYYMRQGTQRRELNLSGIGEPTLCPNLIEYVKRIRERFSSYHDILFPTNGARLDTRMANILASLGVRVCLTIHSGADPRRLAEAHEVAKEAGILAGTSVHAITTPSDWAGQVDWIQQKTLTRCRWIDEKKVVVFSDGRIGTCCIDAHGAGIIGHVDRFEPESLEGGPYSLCRECEQRCR